jgi:hypothetical protein
MTMVVDHVVMVIVAVVDSVVEAIDSGVSPLGWTLGWRDSGLDCNATWLYHRTNSIEN